LASSLCHPPQLSVAQQVTNPPVWPSRTRANQSSTSGGARSVQPRKAPTMALTVMAAFRRLPLTSLITISSETSSPDSTWKKSPPSSCSGQVDTLHGKARSARCLPWDQHLLHLLRLPHVGHEANILALLFGETQQEDDQNRDWNTTRNRERKQAGSPANSRMVCKPGVMPRSGSWNYFGMTVIREK
jgi:hypothetical protein